MKKDTLNAEELKLDLNDSKNGVPTIKKILSKIEVIVLRVWIVFATLSIIFGRIGIVQGDSMEPTLSDGEIHYYSLYSEPEVGDIILLRVGEDVLVKRIVAGPGEQVEYWNKIITLGEDEYFVLGDNRDYSRDSRVFGPIKGDDIIGVMVW